MMCGLTWPVCWYTVNSKMYQEQHRPCEVRNSRVLIHIKYTGFEFACNWVNSAVTSSAFLLSEKKRVNEREGDGVVLDLERDWGRVWGGSCNSEWTALRWQEKIRIDSLITASPSKQQREIYTGRVREEWRVWDAKKRGGTRVEWADKGR